MMRGRNDGAYDGGYVFGNNAGSLYGTGAGNIEGQAPNNTWRRYRFDLIPQVENGVVTGDLLQGYIADAYELEPNWQLKMETIQTSIPASHGTYRYHQIRFQDYSQSSPNKVFRLDDFEIYTKEV
jgi:hypothetical protein